MGLGLPSHQAITPIASTEDLIGMTPFTSRPKSQRLTVAVFQKGPSRTAAYWRDGKVHCKRCAYQLCQLGGITAHKLKLHKQPLQPQAQLNNTPYGVYMQSDENLER